MDINLKLMPFVILKNGKFLFDKNNFKKYLSYDKEKNIKIVINYCMKT